MPTTHVHAPTPRNLRLLAAALRRGELVAIPTETVYGLAAHALDARACRKIFTAKRRPADDPLIVHVPDLKSAEQLAEFNDAARALVRHFWPGPFTLVLPKKKIVPSIVTSSQDSVALRSPAHPLARKLLKLAGIPLAAPSANPFGYVSPTTAAHVLDGLGGRIKHVLDGGQCAVGVESTIVDARDPKHLRILRPGSISARELTAVLRRTGLKGRVSVAQRKPAVLAPGLLDQHYSPHTPLTLVSRITNRERSALEGRSPIGRGASETRPPQPDPRTNTAFIFWQKPAGPQAKNTFSLSSRGAPEEAAKNLYAALRRADAGGFARIVAESAPASAGALGIAINDRLARAAGKRGRS